MNGTRNPGLFPTPSPDIPALSTGLGGPARRLRLGETARWTRINVSTIDCQECAHVQHETQGRFGPRRLAKHRRTLPAGGPALDLCRGHAQAWRRRDAADSGSAP